MAGTLSLVRWHDFDGVIDTIDLYSGGDGFRLLRDGWVPEVGEGEEPVAEALTFTVEGASHDNLASLTQALDDKIRQAREWAGSSVERYHVMLRHQLANETGTRQAPVLEIKGSPGVSLMGPPVSPGNFVPEYRVGLRRMPGWERTSLVTSAGAGVNCTGGAFDISSVAGTMPARVVQTEFNGTVGIDSDLYEFWLGFRSNRFGTRGNLNSSWLCTDGGLYNDTADVGGIAVCSFGAAGDPDMLQRVIVKVSDVTTNYADQRGEFQVLLRAKVSDGTTKADVRVSVGFDPLSGDQSPVWNLRRRVRVDGTVTTNLMLYNLGTVKMPPGRGFSDDSSFMSRVALRLLAERVAGTGALSMHRLVLIPKSEGMLHVRNGAVRYVSADNRPARVRIYPDGSWEGWQYYANEISVPLEVSPFRYAMPVDNCRVVVAAQEVDNHVLTDEVDVELKYFPRYHMLRGSG